MLRNRRPAARAATLTRTQAFLGGSWMLLLSLSPNPVAAKDSGIKTQQQKLQQVRERITGLEHTIAKDRSRVAELHTQLRNKEVAIGKLRARQRQLGQRSERIRARLRSMQQERKQERGLLGKEQAQLAAQVRDAYIYGRQNTLKLLLNQEDPALLGRTLVYYHYDNRARAESLEQIRKQLGKLHDIEQAIRLEAVTQQGLRQQIQTQIQDLQRLQRERKQVLTDLDSRLSNQQQRLTSLREDAEKLAQLLAKLRLRATRENNQTPFARLKGRLQWPLKGRIARHFGSTRKDGNLRSRGVVIATRAGEDVHAVAAGQVVFADWFRNLGLLIIIDHGQGYMSLYGHNQSLYREEGDQVRAGEVIAGAGNSGGASHDGLYFEIRKQGKPANPLRWLAKRP